MRRLLVALTIGIAPMLALAPDAVAQTSPSPRAAQAKTAANAMAPAMEAYRAQRYDDARQLARPLAEKGDVTAQLMLGSIYNNGEGVTPDRDEAAKWFGMAADRGDPGAQYALGLLMEYGHIAGSDAQVARQLFQKAADQGHAGA